MTLQRKFDYERAEGVCRVCGLLAQHQSAHDCVRDLLRIAGSMLGRVWDGNAPQTIAGLREAIAALDDRARRTVRR